MTKKTTITCDSDAIAALRALNPNMTQEELIKGFNRICDEYFNRQPARDWEAEIELKAAYEYGLELLEKAYLLCICR